MKQQLLDIRQSAAAALAAVAQPSELESLRVSYLGKKGRLTEVLRGMGKLSAEERPIIGQLANDVRFFIEGEIGRLSQLLEQRELERRLAAEGIDVTLPGKKRYIGRLHPLTLVLDELKDIFIGMGFQIAEGPELELDYYNFEALNMPKNHPARDTQDTFYIDDNLVLRTQTSPVQIRVMEHSAPPIKIIAPGRVYRNDTADATHSPLFHQIEGLVVDEGITMADLKGTLDAFCKKLYGGATKTRIRPHHFAFTEPSCELDIACPACNGKGCRVCKGEGWIELLGGGMVHPKVLSVCGVDPEVYSGFAFGIGLERMVMRRYGIDDLRMFFENDLRFLQQF